MLRLCSKEEFINHIDFAYRLATDLTRSGYPTYCDGVKTREMFTERSLKAFDRENEEMLVFEQEGEVCGFIHYYRIPDDRYLGTCLFLADRNTEQALSEFCAYAAENFPGYDLFLGFPADNTAAVNYLAAAGFECIESDYNNTSFLDRFDQLKENTEVIRIGKDNYELFKVLHSQIEGDMYWNSARIYDDLDEWTIFVKEEDGKAKGAVYYMDASDGWFEIFGIDIDQNGHDEALLEELLLAALYDARSRGGRVMTFFCDEEYQKITEKCGLDCVGQYLCYKTHLG